METERVSLHPLYNVSLKNFIATQNCIFVGNNLSRYTKGKMRNSKWAPGVIFEKYKIFSRATKLHFYEVYIRSNMMDQLYELYNCSLGCYCKLGYPCHADILKRLCAEQYALMRLRFGLSARDPDLPTLDEVSTSTTSETVSIDQAPALEQDSEDDYDLAPDSITLKNCR